jgi:medium-chain acyl-[acyl-carrier-protein] hydrolase
MTARVTRSPWLPFGTAPEAEVRLLCLPHAGAGATVYRAWATGLPREIGVCPVQPPGREKRRGEPALDTVDDVVRPLAREVLETVKAPYAIFGHSTGALCTFELVREIRRLGGPQPEHLFVAGRRAPQQPMERTVLRGLPVEELADVLRRLGGTPDEVLADHDVLRMIQPLLVADFAVNEDYVYRPEPPLDTPITAFAATRDLGASVEQLDAWRHQTTERFALHVLDGGHFAVFDHAPVVRRRIAGELGYAS